MRASETQYNRFQGFEQYDFHCSSSILTLNQNTVIHGSRLLKTRSHRQLSDCKHNRHGHISCIVGQDTYVMLKPKKHIDILLDGETHSQLHHCDRTIAACCASCLSLQAIKHDESDTYILLVVRCNKKKKLANTRWNGILCKCLKLILK